MSRWNHMPRNAIIGLAKRGPPQIKKAAREYLGIHVEAFFQKEFCKYLHNESKWQKSIIIPEVREFRSKNENVTLCADILVVDSENEITAYEIKTGSSTNYQNFYTGLGESIKNCKFSNYSILVYFNETIKKYEAKELYKLVKKNTTNIGLRIFKDYKAMESLSQLDRKKNKINGLKTMARTIKDDPATIFWHYNKCCTNCENERSCSTVKKYNLSTNQ